MEPDVRKLALDAVDEGFHEAIKQRFVSLWSSATDARTADQRFADGVKLLVEGRASARKIIAGAP